MEIPQDLYQGLGQMEVILEKTSNGDEPDNPHLAHYQLTLRPVNDEVESIYLTLDREEFEDTYNRSIANVPKKWFTNGKCIYEDFASEQIVYKNFHVFDTREEAEAKYKVLELEIAQAKVKEAQAWLDKLLEAHTKETTP